MRRKNIKTTGRRVRHSLARLDSARAFLSLAFGG